MRFLAVGASVLACACMSSVQLRPPSSIAAAVLYEARDDLPGLVVRELDAGRTKRAFYVLEVAKTRAFAGPRLAARDPAFAGTLAGAHHDLRPVFAGAFAPAADAAAEPVVAQRGLRVVEAPVLTGEMTEAARAADAAYWRHLELVDARFDTGIPYDQALRHSYAATTVEEAALMLDRREVLISYAIVGQKVIAFRIDPRGGVRAVTLPATADELRAAVLAFRADVDRPPAAGRDDAWKTTGAALYDALIAPIAGDLARADVLYVSPDDFIANVPFAALVNRGAPLIERMRVTYLPSASVYRNVLQHRVLGHAPRFLAVGNPTFPAGVPSLPEAEREAETLSFVFDEASLFIGGDATESVVARGLATHNIIHFATHGVLLGQRVPGASSLLVAADGDADGFLSAGEIAGMNLSHVYMAVLSACETSVAGDGGAGGDLASLTNAFMIAGVPGVVGSQWKVADASTTRLMLAFYRELLGRGAGPALREAQLAIRAMPGYAHPYYWAPFVLYGWDK